MSAISRARSILAAAAASLAVAAAACSSGDRQATAPAWPAAPVRLVTPAAAGGGPDVVARVLAEALGTRWRHPVVVDNRPGADGVIAVRALIDARDDRTLLFSPSSVVTVNPLLHEALPYDPRVDLLPLAPVADSVIAVVSAPAAHVSSIPDLTETARSRPGALTYSSVFGSPQLLWRAFQQQAEVTMTFIGYRDPHLAIPDMTQGRVHVALLPLGSVIGQVRAGTLTLLAVLGSRRSPIVPEVPTLAEAGYPTLVADGMLGFYGPSAMPPERADFVAREVASVLADAPLAQRLRDLGYVVVRAAPKEFSALLEGQRAALEQLARGGPGPR